MNRLGFPFVVLCSLILALPAAGAEFSPVTVTNLQESFVDAWSGEPAHAVNDRGEIIGGATEGKYWSSTLEGTLIPGLGGEGAIPSVLSESGEVVGVSRVDSWYTLELPQLLCTWRAGEEIRGLGLLPDGSRIWPTAVNARGDIIGWGDYPRYGYPLSGEASFLWTESGGYEILAPPSGGISFHPSDINDSGQMVGDYGRGTSPYDVSYHAVLREEDGTFRQLGFEGEAWSSACLINNAGQVAGVYSPATPDGSYGGSRVFLYSPATGSVDLGNLAEGDYISVSDLSQTGHMTGESWSGAWFWSPESGLVSIPTLGGSYNVAHALNDHDQVVGWSYASMDEWRHQAFVWSPASGAAALPDFDGIQSTALDINNHGRIVGYTMPRDVYSFGWYTIPVMWTIPDPSPAAVGGDDDLIRLLMVRVKALRADNSITKAQSVELLQALESALSFSGEGKAAQAGKALDRFTSHLRQLAKRGSLATSTADDLAAIASRAKAAL